VGQCTDANRLLFTPNQQTYLQTGVSGHGNVILITGKVKIKQYLQRPGQALRALGG